MHQSFSKYWFLTPLLLFALFIYQPALSQIKDTIVNIEQLQINATKALQSEKYTEAVKSIDNANKLLMQPGYARYKSDIELSIADLYYQLEYFDKAAEHARIAIIEMEAGINESKLAESYNLYALILISKGDFSKSEMLLAKADSLYSKLSDSIGKANVVFGQGLMALRLDRFDLAIQNFKISSRVYEEQGLTYQNASAKNKLADALSQIDEKIHPGSLMEAKQVLLEVNEIAYAHGYSQL